jgi:hypothetical protein
MFFLEKTENSYIVVIGLYRKGITGLSMYEIDFISETEFDWKFLSPLDALFPSPKPCIIYDQVTHKIRIRDLTQENATEVYQALCHEILHAVLHRVIGPDACFALDHISNVIDGEYAYIWMGEDWKTIDV